MVQSLMPGDLMALTYSEKGELGSLAPEFTLLGTDEIHHELRDFRNSRVLVLIFMCNHCPYVKAVRGRINQLAKDYVDCKVQVVGINSNDSIKYPDDSFSAMQKEARDQAYDFPYLWDETQKVAKAYGAVCTPDFYVYENLTKHHDPLEFVLRYRGRSEDLYEALDAIISGEPVNPDQIPSMGCSIKWR